MSPDGITEAQNQTYSITTNLTAKRPQLCGLDHMSCVENSLGFFSLMKGNNLKLAAFWPLGCRRVSEASNCCCGVCWRSHVRRETILLRNRSSSLYVMILFWFIITLQFKSHQLCAHELLHCMNLDLHSSGVAVFSVSPCVYVVLSLSPSLHLLLLQIDLRAYMKPLTCRWC